MKKVLYVIIVLTLLTASGTVFADDINYFEIKNNKTLNLNFKGSKIRVDSWNNNYIKIETTYLVGDSYNVKQVDNSLIFDKEKHLQKHPNDLDNNKWSKISNEVYFIITVPKNIPLSINADFVNIKSGCLLKEIDAKFTRIRNSRFMDGFVGNGEKIMIRENSYLGQYNLNYDNIIKENYRGFWWRIKNIVF